MPLLLSILALVCFLPPQQSATDAKQPAHPVGMSVVQIDQASDATKGVRAMVWRPVKERIAPMALGDLSRLVCPATPGLSECFPDLSQPTGLPGAAVLSSAQLDALSRELLTAGMRGAPLEARLPLVVMMGSIGSRGGEFIELAQLLASRGIVAAVVTPPLRSTRPAFSPEEVELAHAGLKRAIAVLTADRGVDVGRLAFVAWSFGGVPALLEASNNSRVRILVSLDSAIRYQYGVDLIRSSRAFQPSALRGRVISLVAGRSNPVATSDDVLRMLDKARVETRIMEGLRHGDFSDLYTALPMRLDPLANRELHDRRAELLAYVGRIVENEFD